MTLGTLHRSLMTRLTATLGEGEARATVRMLFDDVLGLSPTQVVLGADREVEPEIESLMSRMCGRIVGGEPPQYVTGRAMFMGMTLDVNDAVLIPRPETAGLVDLITDCVGDRADLRILDVGTGSGCIAIALARACRFARVTAVDISTRALEVAAANARRLAPGVVTACLDILTAPLPEQPLYDIIVSNPPYIVPSEQAEMESRVVDHEPATALFVPEDDPLLFYRAIARYGVAALEPGGALFFEINPLFATPLQTMLLNAGYNDVTIDLDYLGRRRYCTAVL